MPIRFVFGLRAALALMPFSLRLLSFMLLFMGAAKAHAQAEPYSRYPRVNPQATEQAASPDTPVPAARYQSLFADRPQGVEPAGNDWKKSNATVGQFRKGHADLLKWEEAQAPRRTEPAAPAAAKP